MIETVTGPAHTVTNTYAADRDVLLSKENKAGSTVISKYAYTVNSIGQRTNVAQTGSAFPTSNGWNWGYDSLGQVISAEHAATPPNHRVYQYDAIGNRQRAAAGVLDSQDPSATVYAANNLNQYTAVGTVSPIHDDDGNMTSGQLPAGSGGLVWDAENRLTTVSIVNGDTVHYLYDSQSRRIARTVGTDTTLFVYDSWNVIAEYSSSGSPFTLSKTYLWGTDLSGTNASPAPGQGAGGVGGLLATTDHTGSTPVNHFPTFDGNGNISEYLDFTGTIAAHFEYDPFGNTIVNTDTTNQFAYRFSTKPIDSTTGLYYYGYRWYDPATGRWPSRDPIEEKGSVNIYIMANNDQINNFDYLGLECCAQWDGREVEYDPEYKCCENYSVVNKVGYDTKCCPAEFKKQLEDKMEEIKKMGVPWSKIDNQLRENLDMRYPCVAVSQKIQNCMDLSNWIDELVIGKIGPLVAGACGLPGIVTKIGGVGGWF